MFVKQISVFLENKSGRLVQVTGTLRRNNIDIRALYIADTAEYGILRMIVDKPDEASALLKKEGFTVSETFVLAVAIEDKPGTLDTALEILNEGQISVEYLYAFVGRLVSQAIVVIRVQNPTEAAALLEKGGIKVIDAEEVYGL